MNIKMKQNYQRKSGGWKLLYTKNRSYKAKETKSYQNADTS